jgi:hypothetical protein
MRCDVPVRRISRPSTMMFSGASAPRAPATRISKCTVSPSVASELFKTAVTLGESACANCAVAIIPTTAIKIRPGVDILKCILQASFRAESRNPVAQHTVKFTGCLELARHDGPALPVLIDMARCSAFIKLNPRLLVFHRFQKSFRLAFAHLALLFGFGFGNLRVLVRRLL